MSEAIEDREINNTILKMRSEGISIRKISEKLDISRGQVEYRLKNIKEEVEEKIKQAEPARVENFLKAMETSIFNTQIKIGEMHKYYNEIKLEAEDVRDKILLLKELREQIKFAKDFIDSISPYPVDKIKYANVLSIVILYEEIFKEEPETIKKLQQTARGKSSEELLQIIQGVYPDIAARWKERLKKQGGIKQ